MNYTLKLILTISGILLVGMTIIGLFFYLEMA